MTRLVHVGATVTCPHVSGRVTLAASQRWVRIGGRPVLVRGDLRDRPIHGCPFFTGTNKPCTKTLAEQEAWSSFVAIDGTPVCLESTWGMTDAGPGVWRYRVADPGQGFVAEGPT